MVLSEPKTKPSNVSNLNSNQYYPCYGFLIGVLVDGIRTAGGLTLDPVSLRAKRPVLVNAIRFSESEGWSTVTLIARYEPS